MKLFTGFMLTFVAASAIANAAQSATATRLPLFFEPNLGQAGSGIRFLARTSTGATAFYDSAIVFPGGTRMILVGADPTAKIHGLDPGRGRSNYFIGSSKKDWRTNVPHYRRVHYGSVYRGVDLLFYGVENRVDFDFLIQPRANPSRIAMSFQSAALRLEVNGDLIAGATRFHKPVAYQEAGGIRRPVDARFVLRDSQTATFDLGAYDPSLPLTVDPVVSWSTTLSGSNLDMPMKVAVDTEGNTYIAGITRSNDFAGKFNPLTRPGLMFVAKLNPGGTEIQYMTVLGPPGGLNPAGTGQMRGLAVDSQGAAYIAGAANGGLPVVNALQPAFGGGASDAFVGKLSPSGSELVYLTFLGGPGDDYASGLAVDGAANAYVAGYAEKGFPVAGSLQEFAGQNDAFVAKLDPAGRRLVYSTYLGGSGRDEALALAVDAAGNAYVTGTTKSPDFPVANAYQPAFAKNLPQDGSGTPFSDAFVVKLAPNGNALLYSTYLGGSEWDIADGIGVDSAGNAYISGYTYSPDFPATNLPGPGETSTVLWKSVDGGATWAAAQNGLDSRNVARIVVSPSRPEVLYAATRDSGIFKSTDGGASWKPARNGLNTSWVSISLAFHPKDPETLFAGTNRGVFRTRNGGDNWELFAYSDRTIYEIAIDPEQPDLMFLGIDGVGVVKTADGGKSWKRVVPDPNTAVNNPTVRSAAVTINGSSVYAGWDVQLPIGGSGGGIMRSDDHGDTWRSTSGIPRPFIDVILPSLTDPNVIYAGLHNSGLHKSTDGGSQWQPVTNGLVFSSVSRTGYHVRTLAADPRNPATLYAGINLSSFFPQAGVYKSTDGGDSWKPTTLTNLMINSVAVDPKNPSTIYAAAQMEESVFVTKLDPSGSRLVYSVFPVKPYTCCFIRRDGRTSTTAKLAAWPFPPTATSG